MSLHELVPARRLLARTTLAEYLASRPASPPPVVLDEKMSIGDALNTLAKHGILSAPLVNRASMSYEGFIDGATRPSARACAAAAAATRSSPAATPVQHIFTCGGGGVCRR